MISWCCAPRPVKWKRSWRTGGPSCRAAMPSRLRRLPRAPRLRSAGVAVVEAAADAAAHRRRSRGPPEVGVNVTAYVGLGANLDEPTAHVRRAFDDLTALPESALTARSPLYKSAP